MVGNDNRIAEAEVNGQLLSSLPRVLSETFPHVRAEDGVGAVADFRIGIEEPQSGVGDRDSGATGPAVGEQELAVLVVGASRTGRDVDLIVIVLAGSFKRESELKRVVAFDPSEAVRGGVDGPGGVRGIGSSAEWRERRHIHRRNAVGNQFAIRKYVRVVEVTGYQRPSARLGALEKVRGVDRDLDHVLAGGDQDLVNLGGADGPDVVERAGLVG